MDREGDEYGQRNRPSSTSVGRKSCLRDEQCQQPAANKKPNSVYVAVVSWIVCPSAVYSPLRGEAARVETDVTRECQSVQIINTHRPLTFCLILG
jgi:hypothetical protein